MKKEQPRSKVLKNKYIPTAEFYSQIIDSLQDYSIFTLDNDLSINSWSSGSTNIFGYETEEVLGENFEIIFSEEDKKNGIPQVEIQTALKEGRAVDNRWHLCKDGSKFYAYGLVFPLSGLDGEQLGYVKILRDLTEKKKSEDAIKKYMKDLEELNTHKESILSIVSHDLRSPLAGIIQAAELLKENFKTMGEDELKKMLDYQYELSVNELKMLDYLLDWARIKYASEVFSPAPIELLPTVLKVFETLKEVAAQNSVKLHHKIEENVRVFADEKMLLSILQNIVSNAVKHSPHGGPVTITSEIKEDQMIVQVKDTGIGMSKKVREKLFAPQMNTLSKAREEDKGAGIGLLLVKGFLEKNGGEIWVESAAGKGSSFYFSLPLEKPINKIENSNNIEFDEQP